MRERELGLLRLIVDGKNNQEIVNDLVIALSTVKWHVTNIYGKLNVRSRPQAIPRAQSLDLL